MQYLTEPLLLLLTTLTSALGSLGWAIIFFTLIVRFVLYPLSHKSLKSQKQMKELQPEIKKLEKAHTGTAQELQQAKLDLYKRYNVNPLAGCLPQIVQIGLLFVLYHILVTFLKNPMVNGALVDTKFFWFDLVNPDPLHILPILAGISQLILSLMIAPGGETLDVIPNAKDSKENKKEENFAEMASSMQQQMLFVMPVMTGYIATQFPSGLALYWVMTTIFSIGQQYVVSGPGGLISYSRKAILFVNKFVNKKAAPQVEKPEKIEKPVEKKSVKEKAVSIKKTTKISKKSIKNKPKRK